MSADIAWGDLISRQVRRTIGDRVFGDIEQETEPASGIENWLRNLPFGETLANIWNTTARFRGWILGGVRRALAFSWTRIVGWTVSFKQFVWNFNWNTTDEQLDQEIRQLWANMGGQIGETIGCPIGAAICGGLSIAASIYVVRLDPGIVLPAISQMTENAADEFFDSLTQLIQQGGYLGLRTINAFSFKNVRRFVKWAQKRKAVGAILPERINAMIERWGSKDAEPWTFAEATEEAVDSIDNLFLRNLVEEALEAADDCCIESALIFAQSIDAEIQNRKDQREAVLGVQRQVEITPNRDAPEERIVLAGRDQVLRGAIVSSLSTYQILDNRDVGQVVARDVTEEVLRQQAPTSTLTLHIHYSPRQTPPFTRQAYLLAGGSQDGWREPCYQVPYVDPVKLTWDRIKRAAGGVQGFVSGRYRAYGTIGGRRITVFGSSEAEAVRFLQSLAELSEGELLGVGVGYRQRSTGRDASLSEQMYEAIRVYPKHCFVVAQRRELDRERGRATLTGNYSSRRERIELWGDGPPAGTDQILQQLRSYHTPIGQIKLV